MSRKLLLLGAAVVAAGVFLKRDKVAGLLPGRGQTYEPPAPPPPPGPSNYDAPGPVANTATPVPAPEPQQPGPIDEAAEEAAAAAEAANIGGTVSDYAGIADEVATEEERPLVEAGEGYSEGQEQAERDLREAASPSDGMSDAERQIDEAIEQAANPLAGEQIEGLATPDDTARDAEPLPPARGAARRAADGVVEPAGAGAHRRAGPVRPGAEEPGEPVQYEPPTQEQPAVKPDEDEPEDKKDDEGGSDWRTWSGRSVNP